MSKEKISYLLNKKIKRQNNCISTINENFSKNNGIIIDIKNSLLSFEDLKGKEKNEILKLNRIKKSSLIQKLEKSKIIYNKSNYNSINEINYEIKKIFNYPSEIIENNTNDKLLLVRLINYNKKKLFLIGYWNNILIYEIFDNNIYFITSLFTQKINEKIETIFFLKDNNLENKIKLFIIIENKGLLYEFNLKDYKLNKLRDNIILYELDNYFHNNKYKYELINYNKFIIFNENEAYIYNIINNEMKKLEIKYKEEFEIIDNCQILTDNIFILNLDKKIILFDSETDETLYLLERQLTFYWTKILLLTNNQFLIYSNYYIDIYDFNYITKEEKPKLNRQLVLNNIKNIQKVKQLKNEDLIISYNYNSLLIYDLKKNFVKYKMVNDNYLVSNIILKEIEPNIIVYKNKMSQLNILNVVKGEILGSFIEGSKINIKYMKKIKVDSLGDSPYNNNYLFFLIITDKSIFILYK